MEIDIHSKPEELSEIIKKTLADEKLVREKEISRKIRHVVLQAERYKHLVKRADADKTRFQQKLEKTMAKLDQIAKGDFNILNSINPDKPLDDGKAEGASNESDPG